MNKYLTLSFLIVSGCLLLSCGKNAYLESDSKNGKVNILPPVIGEDDFNIQFKRIHNFGKVLQGSSSTKKFKITNKDLRRIETVSFFDENENFSIHSTDCDNGIDKGGKLLPFNKL